MKFGFVVIRDISLNEDLEQVDVRTSLHVAVLPALMRLLQLCAHDLWRHEFREFRENPR
jgi:hypothetical protein